MTQEEERLVKAAYQDLRQTYTSLTYEWLKDEAEKQLGGEGPTGGPGVLLQRYLRAAGFLEAEA